MDCTLLSFKNSMKMFGRQQKITNALNSLWGNKSVKLRLFFIRHSPYSKNSKLYIYIYIYMKELKNLDDEKFTKKIWTFMLLYKKNDSFFCILSKHTDWTQLKFEVSFFHHSHFCPTKLCSCSPAKIKKKGRLQIFSFLNWKSKQTKIKWR